MSHNPRIEPEDEDFVVPDLLDGERLDITIMNNIQQRIDRNTDIFKTELDTFLDQQRKYDTRLKRFRPLNNAERRKLERKIRSGDMVSVYQGIMAEQTKRDKSKHAKKRKSERQARKRNR